MGREEQLLSASIAVTIGKARAAENELSHIMEGSTVEALDGSNNEELIGAEETLRFYLELFTTCAAKYGFSWRRYATRRGRRFLSRFLRV